MLVALRTGYIDEQFAPFLRLVASVSDSWDKREESEEICKNLEKLYFDILTTFQRDVSIIPPMVSQLGRVLLPEWEKISAFWLTKNNAFSTMTRQKAVCDGVAKDLYEGFVRLKDGLNNAINHFMEFAVWSNLIVDPTSQSGHHNLEFLVANYGPQPTTPEEARKKWEEIRWSGYVRTYKVWMEEGIAKAKKALKDFIARGINSFTQDIDKTAQDLFHKGLERDTGAPPTKRGEKWALIAQVPRGGNVCGFNVVNQVGVHQTTYNELANMLNKVRGILDRRGLSSACANIPVFYRGREQWGGLVKILDTGAELQIAGRYYPEERVIEILFKDKNFDALTSTEEDRHYPPWILQVMIHEIGHYYYYNRLSMKARGRHWEMFKVAKDFPSSYAKNNPAEDFAELWTAYLTRGYSMGDSRNKQYTMTPDCWTRFKAVLSVDPKLKEVSRMVAEAQEDDWESKLQEMLKGPPSTWESEFKHILAQRNERRDLQGEHHFNARLTERDVRLIRKAAEAGFPQKNLAEAFQVSRTTISQIVTGQRWKHVK